MISKKLFPVATSKKDWQTVNEKLNFAFFIYDNLQEFDFCSDEYEHEKHEQNLSKVFGLLSDIRKIAEVYK